MNQILSNEEAKQIAESKSPFTGLAGEQCAGGITADAATHTEPEETTKRNEARFLALSNSAPVGIFESGLKGNCLYTNPHWQQMTGRTQEESAGGSWWNAVHPEDRDDVATVWEICAEQGHDFYMEFRLLRPKGQICWVRAHAAAVHLDCAEITGYIGTAADITEYKQYQRQIEEQVMYIQENSAQLEIQKRELEALNLQLQSLAVTDGLTGLKNHRAFQERLADEFERGTRYRTPLSLLLLDVDHFKSYNDAFGHPAGDQVLKTVAALLQETVRTTDFVGRYGGEEFVVLLPETSAEGAARLAERLRQAIASHPWENQEITISIGIARLRHVCTAPSLLLEEADQALYASKTAGRNKVTLYGSPEIAPDARILTH